MRTCPNLQDQYGRTALEVVKLLIKEGANREAQDKRGWTVLHKGIDIFQLKDKAQFIQSLSAFPYQQGI